MILANANVRHLSTELPNNFHLRIPKLCHTIFDAKCPLATELPMTVHNAESLSFPDTPMEGLATSRADGIIDAYEADILDRWSPVPVPVCRDLTGFPPDEMTITAGVAIAVETTINLYAGRIMLALVCQR